MSEFYKNKRDLIVNNYKYSGMKEKISFYFYRSLMILSALALCGYLSQWVKSKNSIEDGAPILFFVFIALVSFFVSKSDRKNHQKDKMNAVSLFVKEPDINIETVNTLVGEIERYNKKIRTFATWIAGLSATFVILLATLSTNFFIKILDVYLKVVPTDELSKILQSINQNRYMNHNILSYLDIGFGLLFIFIIVILIICNVFTMFTFVKEQILIFLFDVKYELLSGDWKENKNQDVDRPVENI